LTSSWIGPVHNPSLIENGEPEPALQPPPKRSDAKVANPSQVIAVRECREAG
jgi:hypothetical protein